MDFSGTKQGIAVADVFNFSKAIEKRVNGIIHSSVAYTKEVAKKFHYCEDKEISDNGLDDWEHQLRVGSTGLKMDFISSPICAYRLVETAISQTRNQNVVDKVKDKYLEKFKAVACA